MSLKPNTWNSLCFGACATFFTMSSAVSVRSILEHAWWHNEAWWMRWLPISNKRHPQSLATDKTIERKCPNHTWHEFSSLNIAKTDKRICSVALAVGMIAFVSYRFSSLHTKKYPVDKIANILTGCYVALPTCIGVTSEVLPVARAFHDDVRFFRRRYYRVHIKRGVHAKYVRIDPRMTLWHVLARCCGPDFSYFICYIGSKRLSQNDLIEPCSRVLKDLEQTIELELIDYRILHYLCSETNEQASRFGYTSETTHFQLSLIKLNNQFRRLIIIIIGWLAVVVVVVLQK